MQLYARRYDTGQASIFEIADGRIERIVPTAAGEQAARWPWVSPGWFDLQVNGYGGHEFTSAALTTEKVGRIAGAMHAFGVTRFCATVTTAPVEVMTHALGTIAAACQADAKLAQQIPAVHLEGPYISAEDGPRGAHPATNCRAPDWDHFQTLQEAAAGRIRLLTMAVEFDTAPDFIARVVDSGVVVAIGHTAADSEQIRRAVDAGRGSAPIWATVHTCVCAAIPITSGISSPKTGLARA